MITDMSSIAFYAVLLYLPQQRKTVTTGGNFLCYMLYGQNIIRLRENRPEHIFVGWALNTALDAAFGMVVSAHNGKALNQQSA